jgi:cobyrinic acid a,c-diamide synthase
MKDISSFLIAAPSSGSGKTTVTLALLRALKNRGFKVQPFKCGPDYIDTKYHDMASGNKSVNLDLFLSSENHVRHLYSKYASESDACITEGVMGLFDGYDRMKGSSAEIAGMLNIPVIMVINAKSAAYSAAPLLYGFKNFSEKINVAGAIFNFVGSESHYSFLKDACKDTGIESFGYLPENESIEIPSRHLGLRLDEKYRFDEFADRAASLIEKHIDIGRLLSRTQVKTDVSELQKTKEHTPLNLKIAVASDEAFNFMYHENIEYLKKTGTVTFFSPLRDKHLPESDFVYFPGGYPELYAKQLSENKQLHQDIRNYAENGGKILAECGGMMYLSSSITDEKGEVFPMVGIFNQKASMENMKLKLGYRQFSYNGLNIKGHEFHYSHIDSHPDSVAQQYNAKAMPVETKLLRYKNVIAGYTHIYWAEMDNMLDLCNEQIYENHYAKVKFKNLPL